MLERRKGSIPRPGSEQGFTLTEVLVAALVLVIGILATAQLAASSESTTLDAELQQIATEQGERILEDARSLDYAQIGNSSTPTQQPSGSSALSGGQFTPPGNSESEELVLSTTGATSPQVQPLQSFSVDQGGGRSVAGTIYAYVSWRDEDCGVLSLTGNSTLTSARSQLNTLKTQLTVTSGKVGPALARLTNALVAYVPQAAPLKTQLQTLNTALTSAISQLTTQIARLDSLTASTSNFDLCDVAPAAFNNLSKLLNLQLSGYTQLITDLTTTGGINQRLDELKDNANLTTLLTYLSGTTCSVALTKPLCDALVTPIVNNVINPLLTALVGGGSTPPTTAIQNITTYLGNLPNMSATDLVAANPNRNTKRVTVAVKVETVGGQSYAPSNAIWLGTVITDPRDGLVGSTGSG